MDTELVVAVLFLIPKDRVIRDRERVHNLEQQRKGKRRKREMRNHESSCAHPMWEVLWFRSHEPFESFVNAAQFSDSSHRHRASTVSLHAPTALRGAVCVLFIRRDRVGPAGTRERSLQRSDLSSLFHSSRRSNRGVKFVINCQVSGAG